MDGTAEVFRNYRRDRKAEAHYLCRPLSYARSRFTSQARLLA